MRWHQFLYPTSQYLITDLHLTTTFKDDRQRERQILVATNSTLIFPFSQGIYQQTEHQIAGHLTFLSDTNIR